MRHAEDKRPERVAVDLVAHGGDGAKGFQRLGGLRRQAFDGAWPTARLAQLGEQPLFPFGRVRLRRLDPWMRCAKDRCQRIVQTNRILADVQTHSAKTEDADFAPQRHQQRNRQAIGAGRAQGVEHQIDVGEQLVGVAVTAYRRHRLVALGVGNGGVDAAEHARHVLAEQFSRIACGNRCAIRCRLECLANRLTERFGQRQCAFGDAQVADQIDQTPMIAAQAGQPHFP